MTARPYHLGRGRTEILPEESFARLKGIYEPPFTTIHAESMDEIWAGTQSQTTATEAPAKLLGIPKNKVKLHDMLMGGGFGRRGNRDLDFIIDAVLMSKEAGRPVKVMWTREDDIANGRFRPISAHALKAGFDHSGKLTAWQHRIAVDRVGAYMDPVRYQMAGGKDFIAMLGADLKGYDVPASTRGAALSRHWGAHQSPSWNQLPGHHGQ
jgi:CO/xanthine dehydrogenase Mo-binding subunit